jgi:hypothetical protein
LGRDSNWMMDCLARAAMLAACNRPLHALGRFFLRAKALMSKRLTVLC